MASIVSRWAMSWSISFASISSMISSLLTWACALPIGATMTSAAKAAVATNRVLIVVSFPGAAIRSLLKGRWHGSGTDFLRLQANRMPLQARGPSRAVPPIDRAVPPPYGDQGRGGGPKKTISIPHHSGAGPSSFANVHYFGRFAFGAERPT